MAPAARPPVHQSPRAHTPTEQARPRSQPLCPATEPAPTPSDRVQRATVPLGAGQWVLSRVGAMQRVLVRGGRKARVTRASGPDWPTTTACPCHHLRHPMPVAMGMGPTHRHPRPRTLAAAGSGPTHHHSRPATLAATGPGPSCRHPRPRTPPGAGLHPRPAQPMRTRLQTLGAAWRPGLARRAGATTTRARRRGSVSGLGQHSGDGRRTAPMQPRRSSHGVLRGRRRRQ